MIELDLLFSEDSFSLVFNCCCLTDSQADERMTNISGSEQKRGIPLTNDLIENDGHRLLRAPVDLDLSSITIVE